MSVYLLALGATLMVMLDASEARQRALDALGDAAQGLRLTPPLPQHWPPRPGSKLVIFAYRSRVLPTGEREIEVHTPAFRVLLSPLAADGKPRVTRLTSRRLDRTEHAPRHQPAAELDEAVAALIRVVAARAAPPDRELARLGYRAWTRENPVISEVLRNDLSAFFQWLGEDGS